MKRKGEFWPPEPPIRMIDTPELDAGQEYEPNTWRITTAGIELSFDVHWNAERHVTVTCHCAQCEEVK